MNEERDENRAYWNRLTENSPIRTEMYRFRKRMQRLIDGTERSQMLVGPPGCGKDTAVYPALDAAGVGYQRIVDVTTKGLKREFSLCAHHGLVAIINDADAAFWNDLSMIELLMRATGDDSGRIDMVSNLKNQEEYSYVGLRLIIISNGHPYTSCKNEVLRRDKLPALFRRMKLSVIEASKEDRFRYTCYLIICENILRRLNYSPTAVNDVLEWLAANRHRVDDVSPGMVKNILAEYVRPDQDAIDNWRAEAESWCTKGDFDPPLALDRLPRLIGADRAKGRARPEAKAQRSAAEIVQELHTRLWGFPHEGALLDHASDLGYLAGLLQECQRLHPSLAFQNGFERAVKGIAA